MEHMELKASDMINNHIEKIKESGKPFCCKCFDDKKVKLVSDMWLCKDCIYMIKLLNSIKKI